MLSSLPQLPAIFWITAFFCVCLIASVWAYLTGRDRQEKRGRHWDV